MSSAKKLDKTIEKRLEKGSLLGPYRIVRLLAQGGMGRVYEAFEESLGRKVALKVISDNLSKDPEIRQRFLREGQALAKTQHPNVVSVYSLNLHQGQEYLAMEFVEGPALDQYLYKNTLSFEQILSLSQQLLAGTQALHSSGIIHRDLKTKNIIIRDDNSLKIVDLGVARFNESEFDELTRTGVIIGSIYYLAPEISAGAKPSVQTDIWAIGVILYEMIFRCKPFTGTSFLEVFDHIKTQDLAFPPPKTPHLPPSFLTLLSKMLEKDVSKRYANIEQIALDMQQFAPHDQSPSFTTSPPQQAAESTDKISSKTSDKTADQTANTVIHSEDSEDETLVATLQLASESSSSWLSAWHRSWRTPWSLQKTFFALILLLIAFEAFLTWQDSTAPTAEKAKDLASTSTAQKQLAPSPQEPKEPKASPSPKLSREKSPNKRPPLENPTPKTPSPKAQHSLSRPTSPPPTASPTPQPARNLGDGFISLNELANSEAPKPPRKVRRRTARPQSPAKNGPRQLAMKIQKSPSTIET